MRKIFLGKPFHWLVLAIVLGALWYMGATLLQTRNFHLFMVILLALTAGAMIAMIATSRKGDRLTREPFENDEAD